MSRFFFSTLLDSARNLLLFGITYELFEQESKKLRL